VSPTLLGVLEKYVAPAPVPSETTTVAGVSIPIGVLPIVAPEFTNNYRWIVSVDYNLSANDQLRARYIDDKSSSIDTAATLPAFFTGEPTTAHLGTFSEFHNFSPNIVNEFRAAYNRYNAAYNRYNNDITVPNFSIHRPV
jgi:hypothetical protein